MNIALNTKSYQELLNPDTLFAWKKEDLFDIFQFQNI